MENPSYTEAFKRMNDAIGPLGLLVDVDEPEETQLRWGFAILHFDDDGTECWLELKSIKGMRTTKRAKRQYNTFRWVTIVYTDFGKEFEVRETPVGVNVAMLEASGVPNIVIPPEWKLQHDR